MKLTTVDFHNFGTDNGLYFHPSVTKLHDGRLFATMQDVNGSDHYGDPMFAVSSDNGQTWTAPALIPSLVRVHLPGTPFTKAVADPRPFTMQDGSVAVLACTAFYTEHGNASWDKTAPVATPNEDAVYTFWDPATETWSDMKCLELKNCDQCQGLRSACTQTVLLGEDQIIVPIYMNSGEIIDYYSWKSPRFVSITGIYRKVGNTLEYVAQSNILSIPFGRGCIEPSIIELPKGGYAITLRAEDGNMHMALSEDARTWSDIRPWTWDDGSAVKTDSTQQHWAKAGGKVFLMYTRFDGSNDHIMRYRAPLYIAEADVENACLIRASEKVLFPRQQINGKDMLYGNFHCTQLSEDCALATDAATYTEVKNDEMTNTQTRVMATMITP